MTGAAGIVDALAEQVLAEPALLALTACRTATSATLLAPVMNAAAAAVVRTAQIDGLLQHALPLRMMMSARRSSISRLGVLLRLMSGDRDR